MKIQLKIGNLVLLSCGVLLGALLMRVIDGDTSAEAPAQSSSKAAAAMPDNNQSDNTQSDIAHSIAAKQSKTRQSAAERHPSYRLLHDWPSLFVRDLNEQEARWAEDVPVDAIAAKYSTDADFRQRVLSKVMADPDTITRWFFVRVISHAQLQVRQASGLQLLDSGRILDREAGFSVLMAIDDMALKVNTLAPLLLGDLSTDAKQSLLAYIRLDSDLIATAKLNPSLLAVVESRSEPSLQASALTAVMPGQQLDEGLFQHALKLVVSEQQEVSYQGMAVFNEWLINYYGLLSPAQNSALLRELERISTNLSWQVDTRMRALELVKNL